MKKAIALLAAIVTVGSMTVTSYAEEEVLFSSEPSVDTYLQWAPDSTDEVPKVAANLGDLVIADIKTNKDKPVVLIPDLHLAPGNDYTYGIFKVVEDASGGVSPEDLKIERVTEPDLAGGRLRIRTEKGSGGTTSAKIETRGSGDKQTYNLTITTKEVYTTKIQDLEYTIDITGSNDSKLNEGTAMFQVGYNIMSDDDIDNYSEGESVIISQKAPVIEKDQFTTLAKENNYRPVLFEDENDAWRYEGRISGMKDSNFVFTHEAMEDLINEYPDQDYKFLTFKAGVSFPANGEMSVDISDISDDFDVVYTYLYRNGSLTPIVTKYDSEEDMLVFRTNYLGSFVFTDNEITDFEVPDMTVPTDEYPDEFESVETDEDTGTDTGNPSTGASAFAGLLLTLGLAAALTGTFVTRRSKRHG